MENDNNKLNEWGLALERKGLRISRNKTKYIEYEFGEKGQEVEW